MLAYNVKKQPQGHGKRRHNFWGCCCPGFPTSRNSPPCGGAARRWAWGGYTGMGTPQKTIRSPDRLYKAPTDYRKPRQIILSPNRLYKGPEKSIERHEILDNKPKNIKPEPKVFHLTRVSNNHVSTYNIKYLVDKIQLLRKKH